VLLRSPGISPYRKALQQASKSGVQIISPGSLWFSAHPDANTICITGTKGKSTTASLITHLLQSQGLEVQLAGNIGRPLLDCEEAKTQKLSTDWWVIELSSYQLTDLQGHATVAVILNLDQDHLDWHGGVDSYYKDKLKAIKMLRTKGDLVANHGDPVLREQVMSRGQDLRINWFNSSKDIHVSDGQLFDGLDRIEFSPPASLPGPHNLANLAAALTVLKLVGIEPINAVRHASRFKGLPHRLQLAGERDGIRYINDSIASTPLATVAAVESFQESSVTLIVGGMDRGVDWSAHIDAIARKKPVTIIGIPDNGGAVLGMFANSGLFAEEDLHQVEDLRQAVLLAQRLTKASGVVLLSPGAPSFPRFRDYRERGSKFAQYCGFEIVEQELAL